MAFLFMREYWRHSTKMKPVSWTWHWFIFKDIPMRLTTTFIHDGWTSWKRTRKQPKNKSKCLFCGIIHEAAVSVRSCETSRDSINKIVIITFCCLKKTAIFHQRQSSTKVLFKSQVDVFFSHLLIFFFHESRLM